MSVNKDDSKNTWVDPDDALELGDDFFEKATPKIGDKPVSKNEAQTAFKKRLGRPPKQTPKLPISIRLSPEVLDYFRATGKGWQTRVDEALKEWMQKHSA